MDKRFQVFVSSTFTDLQEERRKVIQTVMELDCFPAGMELFPAADEEQWQFIRRVIDDCDYYLLIIGGRYGSVTAEGVSYTEKEYDYAVERGLRVLAFIHDRPDDIPAGKSELNPEARARLEAFREKVAQGRLVKFWNRVDELPGLVALSLTKTTKAYPAVGWIRATGQPTTETLTELNELRKKVAQLESDLSRARKTAAASPLIEGLASLDSKLKVSGRHYSEKTFRPWSITLSWRDTFALLAPELLDSSNDAIVRTRFVGFLFKKSGKTGLNPTIDDYDYDTIKVQLMALKLVTVEYLKTVKGGMGLFWRLTPSGQRTMLEARAIRDEKEARAGDA
jgi:hypothetical protein